MRPFTVSGRKTVREPRSRNAVDPARTPRIATQYAPHGERYTAYDPVFQRRFFGILRTRRIVSAARSEQGRDRRAIDPDRDDGEAADDRHAGRPSRARASRSSRAKASYEAIAAGGRAESTRRTGPSDPNASSAPRKRRFTRLRTTALPTRFETTIATLATSSRERAAETASALPDVRRPVRRTNAMSLVRRRAAYRRTVLDGQALAALLPTRGEHLTAVFRAHTLHESMDALAAPVVGLIRTFHGSGLQSDRALRRTHRGLEQTQNYSRETPGPSTAPAGF